jgi:hypothetical protein
MVDKKAGTRQKVPLIKDTLAIIHKVGSNPVSTVTTAKELGTIAFYNESHNVKEIIKLCEAVNISVLHKTVKMGKKEEIKRALCVWFRKEYSQNTHTEIS